jgi:hypothetical protein
MIVPFPLGEVSLIQDNIVCVTLLKDGEVDEAIAVQLIKATITLSKGKPYSILIDFNDKDVPSTSLAKQMVAARSEHESKIIARAIAGQNLASKIEITFFIQHYKPSVETRIFNTRAEGLAWLSEVMQLHPDAGKKKP